MGRQISAVQVEASQDTGRDAEEERPLHIDPRSCEMPACLAWLLLLLGGCSRSWRTSEHTCQTTSDKRSVRPKPCFTIRQRRWVGTTQLQERLRLQCCIFAGCSEGCAVAKKHLEAVQVVQLAVLVRQHPVVIERRPSEEAGSLLGHICLQ